MTPPKKAGKQPPALPIKSPQYEPQDRRRWTSRVSLLASDRAMDRGLSVHLGSEKATQSGLASRPYS